MTGSDALVGGLVDHLFRHSAGRMVSTLTRVMGPHNLALAEEVVQDALLKAIETWPHRGIPANPAGWLMQTARNRALDCLRRDLNLGRKLEGAASGLASDVRSVAPDPGEPFPDDELRMILMCCHPGLPVESRVALTLKTVGGFSVGEIARAFLASPATVAQRLVRAKRWFRDRSVGFELPGPGEVTRRLDGVLEVLYLLFNEGYAAHDGDDLVRADLCGEAIRLGSMLAGNPATDLPEVHALLALMLLQASRLPARTDGTGALVLLADQDRARWDRRLIDAGLRHLDRSAAGERITPYHLEAGIAACHATAETGEATDWPRIVQLYDDLLVSNPSPVVRLNRAVAVSLVSGPSAGLEALAGLEAHAALQDYYLLPATLADLWLRSGEPGRAADCYRAALERRCSSPERRFLIRRLAECEHGATEPRSYGGSIDAA